MQGEKTKLEGRLDVEVFAASGVKVFAASGGKMIAALVGLAWGQQVVSL